MMSGSSPPRQQGDKAVHKSTFKSALKEIPIPAALKDGINVLRVYANAQTQQSVLTLSEDKFTLYVTSEKSSSRSGWFGKGKKSDKDKERAIDIGAIHRIQRGHATRRFEMARKDRQGSARRLLSQLSIDSNKDAYSAMTINDTSEYKLNPSNCFSIIFRGDWTVDLMILDEVDRNEILDALDQILHTYQEQKTRVSNDVLLLRYVWLDADKDQSEYINASDLGRVVDRINYHMKKSQLNELYEKFGKTIGLDRKLRKRGLTFEQVSTLLHKLKRDSWIVKPVNTYWNTIFGEFMNNGKTRMNVSAKTFLEKFLHQKQGEDHVTMTDVQKLFAKLNDLEVPIVAGEDQPKDPSRIDKNRFEAYLLGDENSAFDPARERYNPRTMRRPISEYWINSSHNTYLTGDQFTSHSKVDMYMHALYRGCKCLELDIWDGDIGGDGLPIPVVWHGHTMTSKILFKDIIKALKLYLNFHPDTFPLILSFENHCSIPYQEVIADQLVQILGSSLYVPSDNSLQGILPTPLDLRGMVVIKGRRPNNLDLTDVEEYDDDLSDDGAPSTIFSSEQSSLSATQKNTNVKVCPALARLTLFHGNKLKDWHTSIRTQTHYMHSFSENKVRSLAKKTDRLQWAVYNQSHMSRTYPAGSRLDSSNYSPILPWSVGCQMVALNFQTNDDKLRLNDGRFRENGGCGYVLKESSLLEMQNITRSPPVPMRLSIRVVSGHCLPKAKDHKAGECIDPYVVVSVYDIKDGNKETYSSFQTSVKYNNGFFPIWNEEKFTFTVENPTVAMLQLSVYDKDVASSDDFVAAASIPIACLRKGLRSVKLFDASGTRIGAFDFASLLIEVKKGRGDKPATIKKRDRSESSTIAEF